jgi:hypothetical protein
MGSRYRWAVVALGPVLLSSAWAGEGVGPKHELRLDTGLASAVGLAGVAYSIGLTQNWRLEAAAGLGRSGLQLSLMPQYAWSDETYERFVGIGLAAALPIDLPGQASAYEARAPVLWLNADLLGARYRSSSGVVVVGALGITMALNDGFRVCSSVDEGCFESDFQSVQWFPIPQFRVGVGYTF